MPDTALIDMQETGLDPRFALPERLFFVIGAQKSGTTWLFRNLGRHPEVCTTDVKELNFWSMLDKGRSLPSHMQRTADQIRMWGPLWPMRQQFYGRRQRKRYSDFRTSLSILDGFDPPHTSYASVLLANLGPGRRIAGEVCPSYAQLKATTYRKMASLNDDVRFVYLLRDPIDRAIASARHNVKAKFSRRGVTLERTLAELRRVLAAPTSGLIRMSRYDLTFAELEQAVSPDRIRSYFFETFFDQSRIDDLTDFLGVGRFDAEVDEIVHEGGGRDVEIPQDIVDQIAVRLLPAYRAMQARFGDALPPNWQASAALAERVAARGDG